jgi:hypothetical protein
MRFKIMSGVLVAAGLLASAAFAPANAQGGVRVGTLTCQGHGTMGLLVTSTMSLTCVLSPQMSRRPERYIATIQRFGVDIGITADTTLAWVVFKTARQLGHGDIAGTYVGVTGGAVIGVGGNANVLIGGSNNGFSLQPLSLQASTGLNVAAGIAGLTLQAVAPERYKKRKSKRHRHRR